MVKKDDVVLLFLIFVLIVILFTSFGFMTGFLAVQQKIQVYICEIKNITFNVTDVELDIGDIWEYEPINYSIAFPPEYALNNYTVGTTIVFSDNTNLFDINPSTGEIYYEALVGDVGSHGIRITLTEADEKCPPKYFDFTLTVIGGGMITGMAPCVPVWNCPEWSACTNNVQSRTCTEFCSGDRKLQTRGCYSGRCFEDSDCGVPDLWDCRNGLCVRVGCRSDVDCPGTGWQCRNYECVPVIVEEEVELEEVPEEEVEPEPLRLFLADKEKADSDLFKIYYSYEPTPLGLWLRDLFIALVYWLDDLLFY